MAKRFELVADKGVVVLGFPILFEEGEGLAKDVEGANGGWVRGGCEAKVRLFEVCTCAHDRVLVPFNHVRVALGSREDVSALDFGGFAAEGFTFGSFPELFVEILVESCLAGKSTGRLGIIGIVTTIMHIIAC